MHKKLYIILAITVGLTIIFGINSYQKTLKFNTLQQDTYWWHAITQHRALKDIDLALAQVNNPNDAILQLIMASETTNQSYIMTGNGTYIGAQVPFPYSVFVFHQKLSSVLWEAINELLTDGFIKENTLNLLLEYREILVMMTEQYDVENHKIKTLNGKQKIEKIGEFIEIKYMK